MKTVGVISKPKLRYTNCWEDAELLLKSAGNLNGKRIISIGSAGDNSFSLLCGNPEVVVTADTNIIQIHLIELKKAAIKILSYENFLEFLGYKKGDRAVHFSLVKDYLPENSLLFWEENFDLIEKGITHQGKFEKYLIFFRNYFLPLIHSKKTILQLIKKKTLQEQENFYNEKWNNKRWRYLFRIFFSRFSLGKFGRDPAFTRYVTVNIPDEILKRTEQHLKSEYCQTNPFLEFMLKNKYEDYLPHFAQRANFQPLKENIDKLKIVHSDILPLLKKEKFDVLNLSNIFEYMDEDLVKTYAETISANCVPGSTLVYWNLLVPRSLSSIMPDKIHSEVTGNSTFRAKDYGFFYTNFIVEKIK